MLITEQGKRGQTKAFIDESAIVLVQDRVDKVVVTMSGGAEVAIAMTFDAFMAQLCAIRNVSGVVEPFDESELDDEPEVDEATTAIVVRRLDN